jgi:hypothetical protein
MSVGRGGPRHFDGYGPRPGFFPASQPLRSSKVKNEALEGEHSRAHFNDEIERERIERQKRYQQREKRGGQGGIAERMAQGK